MEHDALRECLVEIGELILEAERKGVDTEAVREVDIRLRWARNPEKDPKSAMYVFRSRLLNGKLTIVRQIQKTTSGRGIAEGSEGERESCEATDVRERWRCLWMSTMHLQTVVLSII